MKEIVCKLSLLTVVAIWWLHRHQKIEGEGTVSFIQNDLWLNELVRDLPIPQTSWQKRVTRYVINQIYHVKSRSWTEQMRSIREVGQIIQ